ncbi:hypothetical protein F4820DRAFT_26325 [Hypoxylon rubiginosum]|uniref:Uncharacterized protein n=1 Tax=Hypoxylon rubiginosum TaxID=110542 RepID=A0ACB9YSG6_9PEZI|nr:hypothetical protein F4820DRAFT_26325 [Hypoxylon rubiginosum]
MRSFVAVLAVAASLQSGSAAPVAGEQHTTRTLTHSGFPAPTGGFPHPTGGFPHPTGGPRRPDGHGPWVRDPDHKGGRPHPTGTGHAHPTGGHHPGHHSTHSSGVAKPTGAPHKREEKHRPWGHGTGGVPHPTGGPHPTGHHPTHSSGVAKPTGAPHKREEKHQPWGHGTGGVPHPTGGPHPTGHHPGHHPKSSSGAAKPTGAAHERRGDEHHHHPGGAHPTGGFAHPSGGFAHPTGGRGHGDHGKGQGKTVTSTTTSQAAQATGGEKRAEDGHGPFTWPNGGFSASVSVSLPTRPVPTGILPHPTGHPGHKEKQQPEAREAAQEEESENLATRGGDTTLQQVIDIARRIRGKSSTEPLEKYVLDVLKAERVGGVTVDGKPAKEVADGIKKGDIKLPSQ